jgi:hypothetical protein
MSNPSFYSRNINPYTSYLSANSNYQNKDTLVLKDKVEIFDNSSLFYGKPYEQWTAEWWKWAYSIPLEIYPSYDDIGIFCNINQKHPVWFFPGTFNHSVTRQCLIPNDVGILFPILNSECSYAEFPYIKSEEGLQECASSIQNQVTSLNATLDNIKIPDLKDYRIQSLLFNFSLPKNNILNLPENITILTNINSLIIS